ncbi:MAG TPA: phosphopentomutase [Actinobacteria bacterium]|nr:phosphopentomutase [Actinomycetota bacterium]
MTQTKRVLLIVLDSVGAGALPDAAIYGDEGSDTLGNTAKAVGGLAVPNLGALGLGNIIEIEGVEPAEKPLAFFGKMAEASPGKDTTTGHWEMMGLKLETLFPTYPNGFPAEVMDAFEKAIGRGTLGNKTASGTGIMEELGEEHMKTGKPIIYTSADSVFQITTHEEIIPIDELYWMSEVARKILAGEHAVGRVIARPFIGEPGSFARTHRRKDFSLKPPAKTVLDYALEAGVPVYGVGKIREIFAGMGVPEGIHTESNMHGIDETLKALRERKTGIIFTNLVDFDSEWGHRNNPEGYARGLAAADARLPEIIEALESDDILIITADHGCDPTTPSTDHSREYVPYLIFGRALGQGKGLGVRLTFADIGKTIAELLRFDAPVRGTSMKSEILP